jgi:hypothetical protein
MSPSKKPTLLLMPLGMFTGFIVKNVVYCVKVCP